VTGGALAKNVFWQVAGSVDLGTTSHFDCDRLVEAVKETMGRRAIVGLPAGPSSSVSYGNTLGPSELYPCHCPSHHWFQS
jgi:hypothetical protein